MQNEDITPINDKRRSHGYWEIYWDTNRLRYKSFLVNGVEYGFQTNHTFNSEIIDKYYHAK